MTPTTIDRRAKTVTELSNMRKYKFYIILIILCYAFFIIFIHYFLILDYILDCTFVILMV